MMYNPKHKQPIKSCPKHCLYSNGSVIHVYSPTHYALQYIGPLDRHCFSLDLDEL